MVDDLLQRARDRILDELKQKTGRLDLADLGLTTLPEEIAELTHLRVLKLRRFWRLGDAWPGQYGSDGEPNQLTDFDILCELPNLRVLGPLSVSDKTLGVLERMKSLEAVHLFGITRTAFSVIARLPELTWLAACPELIDLEGIEGCQQLRRLDIAVSKVEDLSPLAQLTQLTELDVRRTPVSSLTPLAQCMSLENLDCEETKVSDLRALTNLTRLRTVNCSKTGVADLDCFAGASHLEQLEFEQTRVSSLEPLRSLTKLRTLRCSGTDVNDLAPISKCRALRVLHASGTNVSDLSPLDSMKHLETLMVAGTNATDLGPIADCTSLKILYAGKTGIKSIAPLVRCTELTELSIWGTLVQDLQPLRGCNKLKHLFCESTFVSDLSPLSSKPALESVSCDSTGVTDLVPLVGLPALREAMFSQCVLNDIPIGLLSKDSGVKLVLHQSSVPGIPAEVLSQTNYSDCRESLLAHIADCSEGVTEMNEVKLYLLGNGFVGKTQICRRLIGEAFDKNVKSTHGISLRQTIRTRFDAEDQIKYHIWDFGGQDLYHGTHALFLRSRAIFLIVWTPESEDGPAQFESDYDFRNLPLDYWIAFAHAVGATGSPLVIVQNKCDVPADECIRLPAANSRIDRSPYTQIVHYSALKDRKRASLDDAIREAGQFLRSYEGVSTIGTARQKVRDRILQLIEDDQKQDSSRRKYQILTLNEFQAICEECGPISSPQMLLEFLHRSGVVFYDASVMKDKIILDQSWALAAVYSVFDREKSYRNLKTRRGRFVGAELAEMVWTSFQPEEQEVFLSLMIACDICFPTPFEEESLLKTTFIAPELLPERDQVIENDLREWWVEEDEKESFVWHFDFFDVSWFRHLLARLEPISRGNNVYWNRGALVRDLQTGAVAMLELHIHSEYSAELGLHTRYDDGELLEKIRSAFQV